MSWCLYAVAFALSGAADASELVVSGYCPNDVFRYSAEDGAFVDTLDDAGGTSGPLGVALGPDGRLYVASETSDEILRFEAGTGVFVDAFVPAGTGGLTEPAGVVFGPDRTDDGAPDLYVSSFDGDSVLVFDGVSGSSVDVFVTPESGGLDGPDAGMAFGPDGHLYVPSYWSNRVLRYDGSDGSFIDEFTAVTRPRTIAFRPQDGQMVVTSETGNRVVVYDAKTGDFVEILVNGIGGPTGLAFDDDGTMYVASITLDLVNRYDGLDGTLIDTVVTSGAGGLDCPTFVLLVPGGGCEADLDGSGDVGFVDMLAVLASWGPCGECAEDLDGDGEVGFTDLLLVLSTWGRCGP